MSPDIIWHNMNRVCWGLGTGWDPGIGYYRYFSVTSPFWELPHPPELIYIIAQRGKHAGFFVHSPSIASHHSCQLHAHHLLPHIILVNFTRTIKIANSSSYFLILWPCTTTQKLLLQDIQLCLLSNILAFFSLLILTTREIRLKLNTSGTLPYPISGLTRYLVTHWHDIGSCVPISGCSFDPISGHVACNPMSGTYIGHTPDIGSSCHRHRKPHTWYRDQYRVQYRVSRYRWHEIPMSVSISGTNIGCPDIGVW